MRSRAAATMDVLTADCRDSDCITISRNNFRKWATRGIPGSATGREFALGAIALAGLPRQNAKPIRRLHLAMQSGDMTAAVSDQLRMLGRSYERRGAGTVRGQLVALWADTCPRLTEWDQVKKGKDPLVQAYAWVFRGCSTAAAPVVGAKRVTVPLLVLTGQRDSIVPAEIQQQWLQNPDSTQIKGDEHFWDSSNVTKRIGDWVRDRTPTR